MIFNFRPERTFRCQHHHAIIAAAMAATVVAAAAAVAVAAALAVQLQPLPLMPSLPPSLHGR